MDKIDISEIRDSENFCDISKKINMSDYADSENELEYLTQRTHQDETLQFPLDQSISSDEAELTKNVSDYTMKIRRSIEKDMKRLSLSESKNNDEASHLSSNQSVTHLIKKYKEASPTSVDNKQHVKDSTGFPSESVLMKSYTQLLSMHETLLNNYTQLTNKLMSLVSSDRSIQNFDSLYNRGNNSNNTIFELLNVLGTKSEQELTSLLSFLKSTQ